MKYFKALLFLGAFNFILWPASVWAGPAGWYWGVGYHNPPNASIGLNLTYLWSEWAIEFGMGYLDATDGNTCSESVDKSSYKCHYANASNHFASIAMAGDVNLKYFFSPGPIRPYLEAGTYLGLGLQVGDSINANGSFGSAFSGLGVYFPGDAVDFYISYLFVGAGTVQMGLNF